MSKRILTYLAWIIIVMLAAYLRFHDLETRPMHADEATGARIAAGKIETGEYKFNPVHFHGPTLSDATKVSSFITGERSWKELHARSLRQVTAFFGLLTVLVPLVLVRLTGKGPAIVSAALLATSPLLVYYSRMYIHESLLAFFGFLTIALSALAWIEQRRIYWAAAGISLGLMVATKETFAISIIAWCTSIFLSAIILRDHFNLKLCNREKLLYPLSWMLPTAILIAVFLYTNGFRNPGAITDIVRTFFVYETVAGHHKPLGYYLHLLLIPKGSIRLFWWEGGIAILCVLSILTAYWNKGAVNKPEQQFLIPFFAGSVIIHILVYSLIGYKTPWLMLFPWVQASLLGGLIFREFTLLHKGAKACLVILTGLILVIQTWQCVAVSGRFANDQRNPYAYVPTSADLPRMGEWLVQLEKVAPDNSLEPIGVVGSNYWPLPWYLRSFDTIGYWNKMEDKLNGLALIFVMPDQFEQAAINLSGTHIALPRGLRQDNPMFLYVRNDIWEAWMEKGGK